MKTLRTQDAIDMIDNQVEVTFNDLETKYAIMLNGDTEILEGPAVLSFVKSYLKFEQNSSEDESEKEQIKQALDDGVLKGYTLNIIFAQCKAIGINE